MNTWEKCYTHRIIRTTSDFYIDRLRYSEKKIEAIKMKMNTKFHGIALKSHQYSNWLEWDYILYQLIDEIRDWKSFLSQSSGIFLAGNIKEIDDIEIMLLSYMSENDKLLSKKVDELIKFSSED